MSDHELKTVQPYFDAVWSGEKTCELRKDDRGFQVGDILQLREYDDQRGAFGPRTVVAQVTHLMRLRKEAWVGIATADGWLGHLPFDVVMSFMVLAREDETAVCKACGGTFRSGVGTDALCCCAEGARVDRGAELRYKTSIGECHHSGCRVVADVDGWCDEHSVQFKKYGTHHPVGPYGPKRP